MTEATPATREGPSTPLDPDRPDVEPELLESFDASILEGAYRLRRSTPNLMSTGLMAGFDVGFGVLALLYVQDQTGSELLGGLAFTIGFFALHLGRSELFTENFLVPVTTVVTGAASVRDLLRLWVGTYLTNLLGGFAVAATLVTAYPELHDTVLTLAEKIEGRGLTTESFMLAVLAGAAITLMTWMIRNAATELGALVSVGAFGFLLGAMHLNHVVVISIKMFAAMVVGGTSFGVIDWLAFSSFVVVGNLVGGLGLVTVARLVQLGGPEIRGKRARHRRSPRRRRTTGSIAPTDILRDQA